MNPTTSAQSPTSSALPSRGRLWAGRILTALPALFLLLDGVGKLLKPEEVVKGTVALGYPESTIFGIGIAQLVSLAFYLLPRTSVFGAVLLTGYLGGAVATHVRIGNPVFSHVLFPVYAALMVWGGLWLRESRLREIFPLRK